MRRTSSTFALGSVLIEAAAGLAAELSLRDQLEHARRHVRPDLRPDFPVFPSGSFRAGQSAPLLRGDGLPITPGPPSLPALWWAKRALLPLFAEEERKVAKAG